MKKLLLALLLLATPAFGQVTETPNLSLNIVPAGTINWDTYINENFTILDTKVVTLNLACSTGQVPVWTGGKFSVCGTNGEVTAAQLAAHGALTGTSAHGATSTNTVSMLVARDGSGNFAAGTITATLAGNASTATAFAANGTNCDAGEAPRGIDASGNVESCQLIGGGGGSSITLDLGNDAVLESTGIVEVATAGDTFSIFTEPTANKLLINVGQAWPTANTANTATSLTADGTDCAAGEAARGTDAAGNAELCFDVATQTELNTHGSLTGTSAHGAAATNTASQIVTRDGSGNFAAGTITATLSGNASTATALAANGVDCAAGSFPLGVDASGAAVGCTDAATQAELNTHEALSGTSAHSATTTNTASRIVSRDGSGNFAAGTITATLTGNVTGNVTGNSATATALAANGANCTVGFYPLGVNASGAVEDCTELTATDAELAAIAGLTSAANTLPYFTGSGTADVTPLTAFARTLLDDANAASAQVTLDVQPLDTELSQIAALVPTDDNLMMGNSAGAAWIKEPIPDCDDVTGQHLNYNAGGSDGTRWSCGTSGTGSISGLTTGTIPKAASASTLTDSAIVQDADSVNVSLAVEIGDISSNSLAFNTAAITGAKTATFENISGTVPLAANARKSVQIEVFPPGTAATTGDGKAYFRVPSSMNGMTLVAVNGNVYTAGTTGTINFDLAKCSAAATGNICSGTVVDLLSTNGTIDSGENSTSTATTPLAISGVGGVAQVATGDVIRVDIDAIHTTPSQGGLINMEFSL
jgi:hypothetical protein